MSGAPYRHHWPRIGAFAAAIGLWGLIVLAVRRFV